MPIKRQTQQDPLIVDLKSAEKVNYRRKINVGEMLLLYASYISRVEIVNGITFEKLQTVLKEFLDNLEAHSFIIYNNAALDLKAQKLDLNNPFFVLEALEREINQYLEILVIPLVERFHRILWANSEGHNPLADWSLINNRAFEMKRFVRSFILEMIKKNYGTISDLEIDNMKFDNVRIANLINSYKVNDPSKYSAILEQRVDYQSLVTDEGSLTIPNVREHSLSEFETREALPKRMSSTVYQQEIIHWLDRYLTEDGFDLEG